MVPKGFLRIRVLRMLSEKPMNGAEIIKEMEELTDLRWRPSPGSVYPLLSWLLEMGYTKEVSGSEGGVRRYELTADGRKFLEEEEQRIDQDKGTRFFGPQFEEWDGPMPKEARELVESWRVMRRASSKLRREIKENYSESLAIEAKQLVDEFTDKISKLTTPEE
jgi:DNA-binding PadR family transcriptional regulator